ncbi:MAG: response regulator [Desulfobacterales bacterium]|jgi:DNA-binding NtrC family response regulator
MDVRILIADDEESILDLLARFMEKLGYHADLVTNVGSALELMQQNEYDIILTDKNMPDVDGSMEGGMTLVRFAKENMPSAEVIMITGYATVETAVEAMKLGAFDYIMKPIPLNELKEKIERILEYKKFINSGYTLGIYRTLYNQVLTHLENREDLPEDKVQQILKTLGAKIDQVFGLQKEYETIIQAQADALEKIEEILGFLEEAIPEDSPYRELLDRIRVEARKRI